MEPIKPPPSPKPQEPAPPQPAADTEPAGPAAAPEKERFGKGFYIGLSIILLLAAVAGVYWLFHSPSKNANQASTTQTNQSQPKTTKTASGLQLDPSKNYGNRYSNGILPVGDNMYVSDGARQGFVYACSGYANNMKNAQGGAARRGPWFVGAKQYDLNKKIHVQGSVAWQASFSNKVSGGTRTIITNDLPDHKTGTFPISASDPAYAYDRNPNAIKGQTFTYSLSASPSYGAPNCIGGQVGIMLTGVALFSGFDAAGRDAGAWEIQDSCSGHPQKDGIYHYHTLSSCITNADVKTVIGFALDGFPITGPKISANNILTSNNLDECHGITSQIVLDGKLVTSYHYVMTQDFPYSVACYRAKSIQPPGQGA
jgi:hypothetical protein